MLYQLWLILLGTSIVYVIADTKMTLNQMKVKLKQTVESPEVISDVIGQLEKDNITEGTIEQIPGRRPLRVDDYVTIEEFHKIAELLMKRIEKPGSGGGIVSSATTQDDLARKIFNSLFHTTKTIVRITAQDIPLLDSLQIIALTGSETGNYVQFDTSRFLYGPDKYKYCKIAVLSKKMSECHGSTKKLKAINSDICYGGGTVTVIDNTSECKPYCAFPPANCNPSTPNHPMGGTPPCNEWSIPPCRPGNPPGVPSWNIPHQPTWSIPHQPTWSIPHQPTWSIPHQPTWSIPHQPTWSIPHQPTWSIPHQPTWTVPQQPKMSTPHHKVNTPCVPNCQKMITCNYNDPCENRVTTPRPKCRIWPCIGFLFSISRSNDTKSLTNKHESESVPKANLSVSESDSHS